MASGNVIVTKTVNRTTFEVDKGSYKKTIEAIRGVKKAWEKSSESFTDPKKSPARQYTKAANEMRLVNKRLAETRKREEARASAQSIALAKKEARAKEAIQKTSAARIKQQMRNMTTATPGIAEMRKFYQQQERAAKKAGRKAGLGMNAASRPLNVNRINSVQLPPRGGMGTGMVGDPNKPYSPEMVARQNAQMTQRIRRDSKIQDQNRKELEAKRLRDAAQAARVNDVMSQQRIRLSSKYGNNYNANLGRNASGKSIDDLNRAFKSGTLSAGQYRQSIQALERQFRSAQSSAVTFGSVLGDVRSGLVGVTAAYSTFAAGASVLKQGQFFQGLDATMLMVSDNSEEAGKRIQFVKDQSMRLGLSLKEASQGYVQMAIAADGVMTKNQTDDLFKAFSEYSTALQVDPVKYQRGITALQQMMGKGQIMAEELKGQLAEGIPGSLQVFVKATQEAFNDSSIDIEKLMDMMKKGQLTAKKVMPLIAKYYAEAANKGGALDKALEGNRVAMQRLQQTWSNFQNAIFMGGFGDQMTRIFNDLAKILSSNGTLATNIGKFFGNVIEGAWDMVTMVHDAFVFLDRVLGYYLKQLGVKGDLMKEIFDWGSYLLGIGLFIKGLNSIFNVLSKIVGLRGALKEMRGTLGGLAGAGAGAATSGGTTPGGPKGPGAATGTGKGFWNVWKNAGKFAKLGILAELWSGGAMVNDRFIKSGDDQLASAGITPDVQAAWQEQYGMSPQKVGLMDVLSEWMSNKAFQPSSSPTINTAPLNASGASPQWSGIPFAQPQEMQGKITVEIKAGDLKQYIRAVVDDNDQLKLNMLLQGGNN